MARSSQAQEPESRHAEDLTTGITPADRVASSGSLNSLGQASDPEGAERPVREKLKKTSIAGLSKEVLSDSDHEMSGASDTSKGAAAKDDNNEAPRGRLRKKRSFEDMGGDGTGMEKQGRKRSRDVTLTGQPVTKRKTSGEKGKNGTIKEHSSRSSSSDERSRKGAMLSPKGKRNREAFENEDDKPPAEVKDSVVTEKKAAVKASADEPKTKRHRDSNSPEPEESKVSNTKVSIFIHANKNVTCSILTDPRYHSPAASPTPLSPRLSPPWLLASRLHLHHRRLRHPRVPSKLLVSALLQPRLPRALGLYHLHPSLQALSEAPLLPRSP